MQELKGTIGKCEEYIFNNNGKHLFDFASYNNFKVTNTFRHNNIQTMPGAHEDLDESYTSW